MARLFDDAQTEYLQTGSAVLSGVPISMACFFNSNDFGNQTLISIGDTGVDNHLFEMRLRDPADNDIIARATSGGGGDFATTSASYTLDNWHHACAVFGATNSRAVYLDGGNKGTNTTSATPASLDSTAIGRLVRNSPSLYMSGLIAEAAVWDIALTDGEAAILAKGFSPLFVRPQNIVAYWPLVRDTDQDIVGGFDMVAFNTPGIGDHAPVIYPSRARVYALAAAAPTGHAGPLVGGPILKSKLRGLVA